MFTRRVLLSFLACWRYLLFSVYHWNSTFNYRVLLSCYGLFSGSLSQFCCVFCFRFSLFTVHLLTIVFTLILPSSTWQLMYGGQIWMILIIIPVPRRRVKAFWNATNSIPELLPAWLAWNWKSGWNKDYDEKQSHWLTIIIQLWWYKTIWKFSQGLYKF